MDVSYFFSSLAKIFAVGALTVVILCVIFFVYRYFKILRGDKKSPNSTAATYMGLAASFLTVLILFYAFTEYNQIQDDRKHELAELKGISIELDKKINKAQVERISFFHTMNIKRQAYVACNHLLKESKNNRIPKPCFEVSRSPYFRDT